MTGPSGESRAPAFVRVGGHDLEYRWFGDGPSSDDGAADGAGDRAGQPERPDLPPLVLLHEGLGSLSTWRDFPARLAARTGCRVLAWSRYGYGRSTVRTAPFGVDYMHREAREALPGLLAALGIEAPVLVGHSDGASIALIYAGSGKGAVKGGGAVRGLILEAPHVFTEAICVEAIARIRDAYAASDALRARLARHHADPDASFRGWNDVWLRPAFRNWNIEDCLPQIECPALVIQGRDDEYGTLAQVESIARQVRGPVETLILDECGHAPHRDREDAVLAAMAGFVGRV